MTDDIRRRLACDRCHSQKLRCPRRPGKDTCDRCHKARTSCIFSPFRQKKPPQEDQGSTSVVATSQTPAVASQIDFLSEDVSNSNKRKRIDTHSENIDLDPNLSLDCSVSALEQSGTDLLGANWPAGSLPQGQDFSANYAFEDFGTGNQSPYMPLDFDFLMPNSPQWQLPKENGPIPLRSEPTPALEISNLCMPQASHPQLKSWDPLFPDNDERNRSVKAFDPESISQLVRLLSDLSVRIYDHSTLMPPQSIHDPVPADTDRSCLQKYTKYSIDELFQLTQDLIDVYPSFLDALFGIQVSSASTPSSMTDSSGISNDTDTSTSPNPTSGAGNMRSRGATRKTPPDQSSILLILSVHLRLIGVYEELFKHMAVCMDHKGEMLTPAQREINMAAPQLRMGSYKPPPSSAIPMAMLLFVQFSSQLSNYAAELAAEIHEIDEGRPHVIGAKDDPNALSRAAAEDVKKRAKNMADELSRIRNAMLNSGILA